MSISNAGDQQADRMTNLELLYMHLERQVAELNRAVLEQGQQIERLERELRRQRGEAQGQDVPGADDHEEPDWA